MDRLTESAKNEVMKEQNGRKKGMCTADELIRRHREGGAYTEVEGVKIFYRREGPEAGIPLVLTHGIPRSSFLYRHMIPTLAQRHPVRAWDMYGFGLSDKPQDRWRYNFPEFERFFGKFLDALKIQRAHLVCHDVGGPLTMGFAVRNPHRVASLTICNATIFVRGFNIPGPVLASILTPLLIHRHFITDEAFINYILPIMQREAFYNPEALAGEEAKAWERLLLREEGRLTLIRTVKSYLVVLPYLRGIRRALVSFDRPTFLLWGEQDPFISIDAFHRLRGLIPHAESRVISEASHFLQEDVPQQASAAILDFIARSSG